MLLDDSTEMTPDRTVAATSISPHAVEFGFDIGDRVIISGNKSGILRFLDNTDFAAGIWAGVELGLYYFKSNIS
jgi:hypothetical protein